jgi:hypothetical protein
MPPSRDGGIFSAHLGGFKRQRLTPKFVGFSSTWAGPGSAKLVHFKNQSHGPPSPDGGQNFFYHNRYEGERMANCRRVRTGEDKVAVNSDRDVQPLVSD